MTINTINQNLNTLLTGIAIFATDVNQDVYNGYWNPIITFPNPQLTTPTIQCIQPMFSKILGLNPATIYSL